MQTIDERIQTNLANKQAIDDRTLASISNKVKSLGFNPDDFRFTLSRSSLEVRESDQNWFNFTLYFQKDWNGTEYKLSLSTSGTSYEFLNKSGFNLLALQGVVAREFMADDFSGIVMGLTGICIRYAEALEPIYKESHAISNEIEQAKKEKEAASKDDYLGAVTQFITEGAIFTTNDYNRRLRISDRGAEGIAKRYFRIEKVTNKLLKGSGAPYNAIRFYVEQGRGLEASFLGLFYGEGSQYLKDRFISDLSRGTVAFCSLLPFNHPAIVGVEE